MSSVVDRRNVAFLLDELLQLGVLLQTPRYAAHDRATIEGMLDTAQRIAEDEFLACAARLDANEPVFVDGGARVMPEVRKALDAYAEAGLYAVALGEEDGGLQLPVAIATVIQGIFFAANASIANYPFLTVANASLVATFGTSEQRRTLLPPMLEGRWLGTMCLSEPQAGSSLGDITTKAEGVEGRRYRISGTKMWISGGDHDLSENIVHLVLGKIPGAAAGVKGISLFIVPKFRIGPDGEAGEPNGIALAGLNHKMGQRGTTNCLLNFGEAGECFGEIVGDPGKGLAYMFHMMNEARLGVGMCATSLGLAGYLHSLEYAKTRLQGRPARHKNASAPQVPIIEHADVKRMLLAQKASVEGAAALVLFCAMLVDLQRVSEQAEDRENFALLLDLLTPIAKSWPAEHCLEANKLAIQILGGYGYTRDFPVERLYRDNRLNHIHEGAYGIQALDLLGRKARQREGQGLRLLMERVESTIAEARATALSSEAGQLEHAVAQLVATTETVIACPDTERGLANATLYLDGCGTVVIAWLWLWQATKAVEALAGCADADRFFYEGKIETARYFFRYELPHALVSLELVRSLDTTCLKFRPEAFVQAA